LPQGWTHSIVDGKLVINHPAGYQGGAVSGLTLTVSDGKLSMNSNPFGVIVAPVNDAPITNVPGQTVPRYGSIEIDLNNFVADPDNTPDQMGWQASNYDAGLIAVDIGSDRKATVSSLGGNGQTSILWTATDPGGLSGQNNAGVSMEGIVIGFNLYDPIDKQAWPNQPFQALLNGQNYQLTTDQNGNAQIVAVADSGQVITPQGQLAQTVMPFTLAGKDTTILVPVVDGSFPFTEFCIIQAGAPYWAYISKWAPEFIIDGKNGAIDTLNTIYLEKSPEDNHLSALIDTVRAWNNKYFSHINPEHVYPIPQIGKNVIWTYANSKDEEVAFRNSLLFGLNPLPNNAAAIGMFSHYGMFPGSGDNANADNPNNSHWATRGQFVILSTNSMSGTALAEMGTLLASMHGEVGTGEYKKSIYGGGAYWPPSTSAILYKNGIWVVEELFGLAKQCLPTGTKVEGTGRIIFSK